MAGLKDPKVWVGIVVVLAIMIASVLYFGVPLAHIQMAPETVFMLGGFPVTNTILALLLSDVILLGMVVAATRKLDMMPGRLQNFFEAIIEFWQEQSVSQIGEKLTKQWLPLFLTIFLTIWFSNYTHFLPGFDSVGILCQPGHCPGQTAEAAAEEHGPYTNIDWKFGAPGEGIGLVKPVKAEASAAEAGGAEHPEAAQEGFTLVPFLRVAASDLNMTLALAIIAFLCIEIAGFRQLGLGYLGKFFNVKEGPMMLFVGILELVSEIMRLLTYSFRLFGNIFAGQTMLAVFPFLVPLVLVLPIYGLELFVGLIQAYVFAVLTLAFMQQAVTAHHGPDHAEQH